MSHILALRGIAIRVSRLFPILLLFLAACARPAAVDVPTVAPATTVAATRTPTAPHAAEIRFGLIGSVRDGNVWALFDSMGYSYNDYAVRADYWPRLYRLSIPERRFEPEAAGGMPSAVQQEGALFTATVPLRADLKWSDGSPFTADDVAFTVNTALSFQLGFDWQAAYDPAWLDYAKAVDAHTVKFYFKRAPNVAVWHYGALLGPVVQKSYWAPKISEAAAELPASADVARIASLEAQVTDLQKQVNALVGAALHAPSDQTRQLQIQLQNQQGNLDGLRNDLAKAHTVVDTAIGTARQSLYALDGQGEPTLGTWVPAGNTSSTWTNNANASNPFAAPSFDRAVYMLYPDEASALAALKSGQLNGILEPDGLSTEAAAQPIAGAQIISNQASSARFLIVNPIRPGLQLSDLRRALFCAIDRNILTHGAPLDPLDSFVFPGTDWLNSQSAVACGNGSASPEMNAAAILKEAGYTWAQEPSGQSPGMGLTSPLGTPVPPMGLLAPDPASDPQAAAAAQQVQDAARYLGIPLTAEAVAPADIRYAVFNSRDYDMAIVGWRLSIYPGYLCDWFGRDNPLGYSGLAVWQDCDALSTTSNLPDARQRLLDIQSLLSQDPPMIPLYSGRTYDVTRGIVYPFDHVLDGLSGVYGAPALAVPSPP